MKISIPFEHCVSKRDKYTKWRGGKIALSEKYRSAKLAVNYIARAQRARGAGPLDGPVELHGVVWFPTGHRRDIHNYIQLIADAIEGVAYENDNQIHRLVWERGGIDRERPRIDLSISSLNREV